MKDLELIEELDRLKSQLLETQAGLGAMRMFMKANATKFDLTPEQLWDQVELTKKKLHGELLQMLENVDPAFAARLDKRPPQNVE